MQRLTFGVNSSPFLAISTVHAHAKKYAELFPNAVQETLQNMYVDDVVTGADTVDSTMKLQQDMSEIMMKAAFNLTKWAMRGHRGFLLEVPSHAGMFSPRAANPT